MKRLLLTLPVLALLSCGDDPAGPALGDRLELTVTGMSGVPAVGGRLHVWVYSGGDTLAAGTLPAGPGPLPAFTFDSPLDRPQGVMITWELPGSTPATPGPSRVMAGDFQGASAELRIEGFVTDGRALQEFPGAHSLFTTSNNSEGYPSAENAGLWLFTLTPARNVHETREVKVTPLQSGWTYEGWVVWQGEPKVWIPYGKFTPDELSLLTSRDDTGTGPFSGPEDFRNAGVEDDPGEEWTSTEIADLLGLSLPGGFTVPLELDEVDGEGNAMWHHVITIEPAADLVEGPMEGRPSPIHVYENPIGPEGPGVPRTIVRISEGPTAEVRPAQQ